MNCKKAMNILYKAAPLAIALPLVACQPANIKPENISAKQDETYCSQYTNRLDLQRGGRLNVNLVDNNGNYLTTISVEYLGGDKFSIGPRGDEATVDIKKYPADMVLSLRDPSDGRNISNPPYVFRVGLKDSALSVTVSPEGCLEPLEE